MISTREIVKNIFEVPSGVLADNFGRKKTLQLCFLAYIISFLIFFSGHSFLIMFPATFLFGLGEALRSGTHKAIIFTYLDHQNIRNKKTEVYGQTKSYSLLGSAISAIIGALIVFIKSNYRLIFLVSIIPYILDFLLINSYPDYLEGVTDGDIRLKEMIKAGKKSFKNLKNIVNLRRAMINSAIFDGYFKALKDYLQPVLKSQMAGLSLILILAPEEKRLGLMLGISYFIIHLLSSFTTRNAYRIKNYFPTLRQSLNHIFLITAFILGTIGVFSFKNYLIPVIILYLLFYIFRNLRRPIMLDYIEEIMNKDERATMLSVESQLRTVIIIVLAPVLGIIADSMGLWIMFETAFISLIIFYLLTRIKPGVI